ncbi:Gfo/Idh/MocA family protein [Paenibacillus xerothermodurans]|uniref:Gfo/Idh/MocA family oxidoreductase n=1 Tax=Paenibacillus xerothermodurans TaxID=1977292 RepID=A0A2W1N7Y8_PAEXE|nr:Gfo/Idh/MocA family oxidoreductase [Paenibacillus xerothermodurans]PZE20507.1 gfo/Idh/MocA family oxidoreductase [Paenibacillus xerothermodurans]
MKIGIISFAHMHAYSYAKALQRMEGVELAGIADDNRERGEKYAAEFGTRFYADYKQLLDEDLDGVIVTSENARHKEHVVAAAAAGRHVLCEKPIATTVKDAKEMIDACRRNNVLLQIAFPVRFNTSVIRAKEIVASGSLGTILAMRGTNRGQNPGGWFIDPDLAGGGAVMDHTVHVVDIMRWLTGSDVAEVYAEIDHRVSDTPIDDTGILSMTFDNGVIATLDCSWNRNRTYPTWGDVTLEIIGTEGTLSIDAFKQKIDVHSDDRGFQHAYWGDDMDAGLVRDFVLSIRDGKTEASITGEDGMRALEVALGAYESAKRVDPVRLGAEFSVGGRPA